MEDNILKETSEIFFNIWYDKNFWTGLLFGMFTVTTINMTVRMYNSLLEIQNSEPTAEEESTGKRKNSDNELDRSSCKMVLVVRKDLNMGRGKIAAQCSHAAVGAYKEALKYPKILRQLEASGQAKIVVQTNSEESLMELVQQCKEHKLIHCLIQDAGRTQVAPGSKTVLAVGPGPVEEIDSITGHLKLLN